MILKSAGFLVTFLSVTIFTLSWLTWSPPQPVPPEDYLCLTYAGDHILTTNYELARPGQMLFGNYLETKDRVWVNRVDLKVCGLTRQ